MNYLNECSTLKCLLLVIWLIVACGADQVMDMIRKENYPVEKHTVKTEDGYILSIHRIPRKDKDPSNHKVIILMHGLADSAQAFLRHKRETSTGFYLADAGYDVWMINNRGNIYSRKHATMNATDLTYWDFSWHEIGIYDIPASIDYVLEQTNETKVAYVGVSQGVAALFVTLSELPQYNDKISIAIMMAPAVIFKHMHQPIPRSVELMNILGDWFRSGGMNDIFPFSLTNTLQALAPMCKTAFGSNLCRGAFFTFFGPSVQYSDALMQRLSDHYPAGTSYKQLVHYGQLFATGKFQKYIYNESKNMEMYGTHPPPEYDLSKVTAKVHMLYGTNDWIAPDQNIPLIVEKLKSTNVTLSKFPGYNHIDFTYSRNLKLVNKRLINVLDQCYNNLVQ